MKLLWAVSTVGTGHVFRNLEIARELEPFLRPLEVVWVSGGAAATALLQEVEGLDLLPPVPIPVRDGWLDVASLARNWLHNNQQSRAIASQLITTLQPDAVLADEVPGFALTARDFGIPAIYLTDLLAFDFARPLWRSVAFNLLIALGSWKINKDIRRTYEQLDLLVLLNDLDSMPPAWRRWASEHCLITGPVARRNAVSASREQVRQQLGLRPEQKLILVTAGGSGASRHLIYTAGRAFGTIKRAVPNAVLLIVLGPAIEPESCGIEPDDGVMIRQYERELVAYLGASDLVICNSGLSTLTEIALAAKVPTITCPIGSHWEQQANARAAVSAGYAVRIDRARLNPESLARTAVEILTDVERSRQMIEAAQAIEDHGGAAVAARGIADVLSTPSLGI